MSVALTGGVGVTEPHRAQMNLRPASMNCMYGFMYALHSAHLTGPTSPKSTNCRCNILVTGYSPTFVALATVHTGGIKSQKRDGDAFTMHHDAL